jgi:hypothetical protein
MKEAETPWWSLAGGGAHGRITSNLPLYRSNVFAPVCTYNPPTSPIYYFLSPAFSPHDVRHTHIPNRTVGNKGGARNPARTLHLFCDWGADFRASGQCQCKYPVTSIVRLSSEITHASDTKQNNTRLDLTPSTRRSRFLPHGYCLSLVI